ncbi:hypothetical protein N9X91_00405 [Alphaproteobacteria bacterium]|nr:hypothetical protein [Alphaproteobacteria bacterium]
MSARVQAIEKAIIALLDARGVDVGMEPDFTTQAKALGGRAYLNRWSKSNLPERQGSGAGLWSAELNDKEISSALDQIEYGIDRIEALEPEIFKLLKLQPSDLSRVRDFAAETRDTKQSTQEALDAGVDPKWLQNVDLIVVMEAALNGAIWAHAAAKAEPFKVPRKLTGKLWISYYKAVAAALGVSVDNYERNYQTMLKARQALAKSK